MDKKIVDLDDVRKRARPSYRRGVEFIALNLDLSGYKEFDPSVDISAASDCSVITLAEAFGKDPATVASDVRNCYEKNINAVIAASEENDT